LRSDRYLGFAAVSPSNGNKYFRIPKINFPTDSQNRTVLMQDVMFYPATTLYTPTQAWIKGFGGSIPPWRRPRGVARLHSCRGDQTHAGWMRQNIYIQVGQNLAIKVGQAGVSNSGRFERPPPCAQGSFHGEGETSLFNTFTFKRTWRASGSALRVLEI
jgi:hypothetical protein